MYSTLVLLLVLAGATELTAQDDADLIALIDRFDDFDCNGREFVKVTSGGTQYEDEFEPNEWFGFLVDTAGERFTVRFIGLGRQSFTKTPPGTDRLERIDYETVDFEKYADDYVSRLAAVPDEEIQTIFWITPDYVFLGRAEAVLLARYCKQRGLDEVAAELLSEAKRDDRLRPNIAFGLQYTLSLMFADPAYELKDILEEHRQWLSVFPDAPAAKYVTQRAETLERMLAEETPSGEAGELPRLVYELRNQNGPLEGVYDDGWYITRFGKGDGGAAQQLLAHGMAAVPELMGAISNEGFTRVVWYSSRRGGSFHVMTVGQLAGEILQRITGLRFYGDAEERMKLWRTWWSSFEKAGEEEAYCTIARQGDAEGEGAARVVMERWPHRVADVVEGAKQSENKHYRGALIELVSRQDAPVVDDFLKKELHRGPYIAARVMAARALLDRDDESGVGVFMAAWRNIAVPGEAQEPDVPEGVADFDMHLANVDAQRAIAEFLLGSGRIEAIERVGDGLLEQAPSVRRAVLNAFVFNGRGGFIERTGPETLPAVDRALERVLGSLLADDLVLRGLYTSFSMGEESVELRSPTLATRAACELVNSWPETYSFDPKGTSRVLHERVIELRNTWRQRQGLEPLPVTPRTSVRTQDPEVERAVRRLVDSEDDDERRALVAKITDAGVGALPWVWDALAGLPEVHSSRNFLVMIADTLGRRIGEAHVKAWKRLPLHDNVDELRSGEVTGAGLVGLIVHALDHLPDKCGTIDLHAERGGDGEGIFLQVELTPSYDDPDGLVRSSLSVSIDGRNVMNSSGTGIVSGYDDIEDFSELVKAASAAVLANYDSIFEIRVRLKYY